LFRLFNIAMVLSVLGAAFVIYSLEHANRTAERRIAAAESGIVDTREGIKLLKAEWSNLTRPERLQKLANEHLKLQPMKPDQLVSARDLAKLVPDEPQVQLNDGKRDPIADILKKME
jgi:cell division protein FtsL